MLTTGRRVEEKAPQNLCPRREKDIFVTEADMPLPERPERSHREGEQQALAARRRDGAGGPTQGLGPDIEPAEHLGEGTGRADREEREKRGSAW
jgi:hypothetical protein